MSPQDFKELARAKKNLHDAEDALYAHNMKFFTSVRKFVLTRHPELKDKDLRIYPSISSTSAGSKVLETTMRIVVSYTPDAFRSHFGMSDDEQPQDVVMSFTPEEVFGWGLADLEKIGLKYK